MSGSQAAAAAPPAPTPLEKTALPWLVALLAFALLGVQFVFWRKMPFDVLRFCTLASVVLLFLLWGKHRKLQLDSGPAATLAGLALLALVLQKSLAPAGELFAAIAPVLLGLGLALLASGFRGLRQYWKEFAILLFIQLPFLLRLFVFDLFGWDPSPVTALAATGITRLLGWQAQAQDVYVSTPGGMVAVFEGCSGVRSMFFLFGLAILLLVLFPPAGRLQGFAAPLVGIAIAFAVNACRVSLLIILVSESRHEAFEYWHLGSGALLFESASVFLFILFYRFYLLAGVDGPLATTESPKDAILG